MENSVDNFMLKRIQKIRYIIFKRLISMVAGIIGIVTLIPVTIFVLIMKIIYKERGPIFFCQNRIGKNGKEFKLIKFRSMVVDADKKLKEYLDNNPKEKEYYNKYKKLKSDPRITKVGRILRKTSLDEWPQFMQCLSTLDLIGPRPYLPKEKEEMGEYYEEIIKFRPRDYRTMASLRKK